MKLLKLSKFKIFLGFLIILAIIAGGFFLVRRTEAANNCWTGSEANETFLHQKTALTAVLVNLSGMPNGWIDNLGQRIPQNGDIVKLENRNCSLGVYP